MRQSITPVVLLLSMATALHAQGPAEEGFTCKANENDALTRRIADDPAFLEDALRAQAELDAWTAGFQRGERGLFIIPVVVHIIHNNGLENISDAQVIDGIRVLNEDFNKLNPEWPGVRPEFLDIVAEVGVEFRLARKDPQGNCTNGITRTVSTQTYQGDFEMTQLIQWPRNKYMNVWVAASANGAAGYTYYPMWLNNWPEADGMVLRHDYLGSIGTGHPSRSHVWAHEVGHWINLMHCWGNSNEPGSESNCSMDDDVADTPLTKGWTSCWLAANSCGSELDNVENFMEYSYCSKMFTLGQAERMVASLTSSIAQRNELWQPENLIATGVEEEPVLCAIGFTRSKSEVCTGETVQFTDASYHNVQSRFWGFPGGTPSFSTAANPAVTYQNTGRYSVSLIVSDGDINLNTTEPEAIAVLPAVGRAVPHTESFEDITTLPTDEWLVRDPDGDGGFQVTSAAGYTGGRSVRLGNGPDKFGRVDRLVSSTYDLSGAQQITITYRYAFARRNPNNDDRLRVYVSSNCGTTWSLRQQLRGSMALATAPDNNGTFVPDGQGQWGYALIDNISFPYHSQKFRVRFEFESHGGNDLYLDDININGVHVGLEELALEGGGLLVVPNPAAEQAQVLFHLETGGAVRVELFDALGRTAMAPLEARLPAGPQRIDLPVAAIATGTYVLRVSRPEGNAVTRFVRE
ncbi:MAG: T9SS type A sorting domain-containing protein [Flavobacteriales bacterium]|nr:T9SS type A sorting domain-containing protein [Flavobacteriales bacterium]